MWREWKNIKGERILLAGGLRLYVYAVDGRQPLGFAYKRGDEQKALAEAEQMATVLHAVEVTYTVAEAAQMLGVTRQTIYRVTGKTGKLTLDDLTAIKVPLSVAGEVLHAPVS